jgi:hypothetical protein
MYWITCVVRMQMGYIKSNVTLNYFMDTNFEMLVISVLQIKSCDNHAYLFTKSLPLAIFDKCVKDIGMRRLKDLQGSGGRTSLIDPVKMHHIVLFSFMSFITISHERFLTRQCAHKNMSIS